MKKGHNMKKKKSTKSKIIKKVFKKKKNVIIPLTAVALILLAKIVQIFCILMFTVPPIVYCASKLSLKENKNESNRP